MSLPSSLTVQPIRTRIFKENENLVAFVIDQVPVSLIGESMILAITSKIVSLSEGRVVDKSTIKKSELIAQEADHNFGEVGYGCYLTVKHGLFIPSAGIDESNSQSDKFILYPLNPFLSLEKAWVALKEKWNLKNLGIVMTDSHTTPLRRGVTGISLAHWGFRGLKSMIGTPDLFGRELKMTTVNVADGLAAAATLVMGEADESRPLAIMCSGEVVFSEQTDSDEVKMPLEDDLYYPFFKNL
jgi:F420-0:gamma-glutamyl ligase